MTTNDFDSADNLSTQQISRAPQSSAGRLRLTVVGEGGAVTYPLPALGQLTIGRASSGVDVRLDDPSVSRQHAILHMGPPLQIQDCGSVNGLRVNDAEIPSESIVPLNIGDVVEIGASTLLVQEVRSSARARRLCGHDYFEIRLEEECMRAAQEQSSFALIRLRISGADLTDATLIFDELLSSIDIVGAYGPDGEFEILRFNVSPENIETFIAHLDEALRAKGYEVKTGYALFPKAKSAGELMSAACAHLSGSLEANEQIDDIVVEDPVMQNLHRLIERIARSNISVLLLGETGVGKEVFAAQIHEKSPRSSKPYLRLNCAALSEQLLESELFGHEKGAFTGAVAAKPGLLEAADGGTVFLDEAGELPMSVQVKLLRVLEERRVQRVGGLQDKAIDVRFIAATNRNLEDEVAEGNFRQDLYFRLNGISVVIPPLRERIMEVEHLANLFIKMVCERDNNNRIPVLSPEALEKLKTYHWPGNIRELRNIMDRAVLLCATGTISPEHLPLEKLSSNSLVSGHGQFSGAINQIPLLDDDPTQQFMSPVANSGRPADQLRKKDESEQREIILAALERCEGNQTKAAAELGISRRTLINRLESYGIKRPRKSD